MGLLTILAYCILRPKLRQIDMNKKVNKKVASNEMKCFVIDRKEYMNAVRARILNWLYSNGNEL